MILTEENISEREFIIVHCNLKLFNENFKKDKLTDVVNYHDIMSKLENNDIYKNVPDRRIIEYYIIRKINGILESNKSNKIYYLLENLEVDIIRALKKVLRSYDLKYKLVLAEDDDIDDIKTEFDTIEIVNLNNDKTQVNK
jgi:hypothetical protein